MVTIKDFVDGLQFGGLVEHGGLAMLPILHAPDADADADPPYLLLQDAAASGLIRVAELKMATVPEIVFENLSDRPVLMLGGEELAGARQNRIINLTILAPPQAKIVIPVSCVEAGRWRPISREFAPTPALAFRKLRARTVAQVTRALRTVGRARTDQGAVWADVEEKLANLRVTSPTSSMRAAYDQRLPELEDYVRVLTWCPGQVGAVFALNGQPAGLDLFDHQKTCARILPRLLRGYALDALEQQICQTELRGEEPACSSKPGTASCLEATLRSWAASIGQAEAFSRPAIGMGTDVRIESTAVAGAALWAEDRYLHLCAFPAGDGGHQRPDLDFVNMHRPRRRSERRHRDVH